MPDDPRAFREHLTGETLRNAQRRLLCVLLRQPGLLPAVLTTGIQETDFGTDNALGRAFRSVLTREIDRSDSELAALMGLGVTMDPGQALSMAAQICESNQRARQARGANFEAAEGAAEIRAMARDGIPLEFVDG